jgi:hypothetical protein
MDDTERGQEASTIPSGAELLSEAYYANDGIVPVFSQWHPYECRYGASQHLISENMLKVATAELNATIFMGPVSGPMGSHPPHAVTAATLNPGSGTYTRLME